MEYGIETIGQNPQLITLVLAVVICVVALIVLFALSRLLSGRKDLEKERLALDTELYRLEKFASMKKKEGMGERQPMAESFWPKKDQDLPTAAEEPAAEHQPVQAQESRPEAQQAEEKEDDEFADIRKENLVRDWSEND